ncbi:hypothetical protein [Micromonospora echinospora]|uniref:VG15 protein n=1 Tax=Micromonospora echinospora TaxID=1877 RepID=UPI003A836F9F
MSARTVALDHYRRRRRLADALAAVAARLWRRINPDDIARSWATALVDLVPVTNAAQLAAARTADAYLDAVLDAQGIDPTAEGRVVPAALAGVASDGRPLASLLYEPAIGTLSAIGAGATVDRALAGGYVSLDMMVRTQVADAGRAADQAALVTRPKATGYVRMLVGKSCSRCVVLAGKRFGWNAGFLRHPRCDCIHVPAAEDTPDDVMTNPKAYFESLSTAEQDRAFTAAGAQAIRDGADIFQVVNARRGARGLATAGARITAAEARMLRGGRDRGGWRRSTSTAGSSTSRARASPPGALLAPGSARGTPASSGPAAGTGRPGHPDSCRSRSTKSPATTETRRSACCGGSATSPPDQARRPVTNRRSR